MDAWSSLDYTFRMASEGTLNTVHLSTAKSWRGGENQIFLLCRGLIARGQKALILAPKNTPLLERAKEAGIPTRVLTLRSEIDPAGTWRLGRLLRELKPDILHLHDAHAALPGQIAGRILPPEQLAVIAHRRTAFRIRGKWKYGGRVNKVIAISSAAREQVLKAGLPEAHVEVVHSGIEFSEPLDRKSPEAATLRSQLGLTADAILLAHAAAMTSEKRQIDLVSALKSCKNNVLGTSAQAPPDTLKAGGQPDVHLAIAGSGNLLNELEAQVKKEGLAGWVHFLGFRRDLRALWAAADVAIYASEVEGLCTALIEAQGAGLPAIVTRAGGMVEVVEEGATGLTVPIGDVDSIAAAIQELSANAKLRNRMGKAASSRARKLFSADAMVDGTLAVYRAARGKKTD